MTAFDSDEDNGDEELRIESSVRSKRRFLLEDDDEDSDEAEDDIGETPGAKGRSRRHKPPRPSIRGIRQSSAIAAASSQRNRRRSSARFLRLSIGTTTLQDNDSSGGNGAGTAATTIQSLNELYKKAIKMNAENKINATNSWSLNLIDNIDRFLLGGEDSTATSTMNNGTKSSRQTGKNPESQNATTHGDAEDNHDQDSSGLRVNFTKASCTLDASVKIYSYRVDDVHLTSYKVLANLHRNDNHKESSSNDLNQDDEMGGAKTGDDDPPNKVPNSRSKASSKSAGLQPTIETNLANLNANKLDSAYDIDPLFHKMSKTFDEGGAKGLLLVNLVLGDKYNIVFDSSEQIEDNINAVATGPECSSIECVDLSPFAEQLQTQNLESLSLVPQLSNLREEFAQLKAQGYVDDDHLGSPRLQDKDKRRKSQRYQATDEEEAIADRSIHQEAMERSRVSLTLPNLDHDSGDETEFARTFPTAFDDGCDDDDNEAGFDQYMNDNQEDPDVGRFSSISFGGSFVGGQEPEEQPASQTAILLDALASTTGSQLWSNSGHSYWDVDRWMSQSQGSNNYWAGGAHWHPPTRRKPNPSTVAPASSKKKKIIHTATPSKVKERVLVDLTRKPDLSQLLPANKQQSGGKRTAKSKMELQWSKSSVTKYTQNENVLPFDAGVGLKELTSFFLRPDISWINTSEASSSSKLHDPKKSVGFDLINLHHSDDGSLGGDEYDGDPGFTINHAMDGDDNDDDNHGSYHNVIPELDGIRKVNKVQVGFATVAKKVDVKRLKRDLWTELESRFQAPDEDDERSSDSSPKPTNTQAESNMDTDIRTKELNDAESSRVSFQDVVQSMEMAKTQFDVTLPFYFICVLHLANEKGLELESTGQGLDDFYVVCR